MRAILAALALAFALAEPTAAQDQTITVTGEGQVAAVPDMALVRVGVTTDSGTAAEALASNNAAMERVISRLAESGIEPRDVQTSALELGPRYADRPGGAPQVEGYTTRNILIVRVRDLDRLGAILDAAAGDGANTFEGLTFGMANPEPLNEEALRLAVADARHKAELLAEEAGVTLGEVRVIDTMVSEPPLPMEAATMRMAAESVPVARGELEIATTIRMVFAIGE